MAVVARISVRGTREFRNALKRLSPRENAAIRNKALRSLAFLTASIAKEKMIKRGRGLKAKPLKSRLTYRHGDLTRSITTAFGDLPKFAEAGTALRYKGGSGPEVHELGGRIHPKRPFMKPAGQEASKKAEKIFLESWVREFKGVRR